MKLLKVVLAMVLGVVYAVVGPIFTVAASATSESADLLEGNWHVYTADGKVSVGWNLQTEADVKLSIDGEEVVAGSEIGHFYSPELSPGTLLHVSLVSETGLTPTELTEISKSSDAAQTADPNLYQHIAVSGLVVTVAGQYLPNAAQAATGLPGATLLRYQTFIPYDYVEAPQVCSPNGDTGYWFNGNGRGFDPNSSQVKTRMDVHIDWLNGGNISLNKYVGLTLLYKYVNGAYIWQQSDRQDSSSMAVAPRAQSSDFVTFEMSQNPANPLCVPWLGMGIWFDYNVSVWRTGAYELFGPARKVPSHEAYFMDSNQSTWHPILKTGFAGREAFDCFNPFNSLPNSTCYINYNLQSSRY